MLKNDGEVDSLNIGRTEKYLQQMNGEHVFGSWKVSGRDGERKKYNAEVALTEQTLFVFIKKKVYEIKRLETLRFILYCVEADEIILQFKKESSLRFFAKSRDELVRCLINRFSILQKKKARVYFIKEANLHRFFTTEEMLDKNLECSMEDINFEMMNLCDFNTKLSATPEFKEDKINDTEVSAAKPIWCKPGKKSLRIEDFKILKVLGRGGFGKVLLCQNSLTQELFAMKILCKKDLVNNGQVEHTKAEQDVLAHINHQFLVSLEAAFMDKYNLYFIMELMKGGELYSHLARRKRFDEGVVKFFAACITLALGHLHSNHYIYRDIKLENILIDSEGFLKLTDFGLSKYMKDTDKTHTLCGTKYYLAPEVITAEGHSYPVDWWGLGVVIYELIFGHLPFFTNSKNDRILMKIIRTGNLIFDEKIKISPECKDFITKLLVKKSADRLGSIGGSLEVMDHPWFATLDWSAIMTKSVVPPYLPKVDENNWLDNFDTHYTGQDAHKDSRIYELEESDEEVNKYFDDFDYARAEK